MRTKDFDPDAVLELAMQLFWTRGYSATSIADLVGHLGIARASLYATFGSKSELYRQALDRYCQQQAGPVLDALAADGPVLPRIAVLLERLAEAPHTDPDRRGCLVVNAATELVPGDEGVTRRVVDHLGRDEDLLTEALQRAQQLGEVDRSQPARAQARFLVATIQGLRVVGKATADPELLHDVVRVALDALRAA